MRVLVLLLFVLMTVLPTGYAEAQALDPPEGAASTDLPAASDMETLEASSPASGARANRGPSAT